MLALTFSSITPFGRRHGDGGLLEGKPTACGAEVNGEFLRVGGPTKREGANCRAREDQTASAFAIPPDQRGVRPSRGRGPRRTDEGVAFGQGLRYLALAGFSISTRQHWV